MTGANLGFDSQDRVRDALAVPTNHRSEEEMLKNFGAAILGDNRKSTTNFDDEFPAYYNVNSGPLDSDKKATSAQTAEKVAAIALTTKPL